MFIHFLHALKTVFKDFKLKNNNFHQLWLFGEGADLWNFSCLHSLSIFFSFLIFFLEDLLFTSSCYWNICVLCYSSFIICLTMAICLFVSLFLLGCMCFLYLWLIFLPLFCIVVSVHKSIAGSFLFVTYP